MMMTSTETTPWLPRGGLNPQAELRLFCFPHAGGGALTFRGWRDEFPPGVEVCPVQLPGRERRLADRPYTQLRPLVEATAQALAPHLDRPFAFFGHSMGALIAFELTRLLRREGRGQPEHLFVSGRPAPQLPRTEPVTYDLPEPEFLEDLRRLNGTPKEVLDQPALMLLMIPLLRADFEVAQTYVYSDEAPLDCPLTAFGGLDDPDVSRADLEAWRAQTTAAFSVKMFPGDHFFLSTAQTFLLRSLRSELKRSAGTHP